MKNKQLSYAALVIAVLAFTVMALAAPMSRTSSFWIAFTFTDIAFASQPIIWSLAFMSEKSLKSKFLGIPIVHVGVIYLLVQLLAFIILAITNCEAWVSAIVCVIILSVSLLSMISGGISKNIVSSVESKVQSKTHFLKELKSNLNILADEEDDKTIKAALMELVDEVRYSDPMSDNSLDGIESEIKEKISGFNLSEDKQKTIDEISLLLKKRNNIIETLK